VKPALDSPKPNSNLKYMFRSGRSGLDPVDDRVRLSYLHNVCKDQNGAVHVRMGQRVAAEIEKYKDWLGGGFANKGNHPNPYHRIFFVFIDLFEPFSFLFHTYPLAALRSSTSPGTSCRLAWDAAVGTVAVKLRRSERTKRALPLCCCS